MNTEPVVTEPVVLIDMMNLVFRSHWAFQNLQVDGEHTGVQYGILKTILDLRTNISSKLVFCWDHGVPVLGAERPRNWREDVVPTYKANRKRDPEVHKIVVSQLLEIHDVICWLGYSHASVMGLEADDIIGVLTRRYPESLVFSTDKDFYQLLNSNVNVLVPKKEKGSFRKISKAEIEKEYEISTDRFAEYLALGGDSADNIKPMRGMGPKTAIKLIQNGVDLRGNNEFKNQPKTFREKFPKLEEVWENILKSYHAAQIPTDWKDPRIYACLQLHPEIVGTFNASQSWKNNSHKELAQKKFISFLADKNMVSLLSMRNKFFETINPVIRREQTPCPKPVKKKLVTRTLI